MYETLEILREGAAAFVWMNRPDRHNAFNETVVAELSQAFAELTEARDVRVVVLGGRGKSFSAGADLAAMKASGEASFDDNFAAARKMAEMLRLIAECPKPVVARVQGAALGGGLGLAAACDICVASSAASFATTEVKFGILPSTISPYVLRAIGARQASRYFLTAERIDAARAREIGLVHEVCEPEALDATIERMIATLSGNGPSAIDAAKALIRAVSGRAIDDTLREETARSIADVRASAEAREGLSAFLEKRAPRWT